MVAMVTRRARAVFCSVALLVLVSAPGADAEAPSASRAFERLRSLVGTWTAPLPNGKELRLSYRLISSGSALVETYVTPSGKETETIYHLDGTRLLATHYCAQGNQPRLRLTAGPVSSRFVFEFVDATNLETPQSSHLHRFEIVLTDADHFTKAETYRAMGVEETETLRYTRAVAARDR